MMNVIIAQGSVMNLLICHSLFSNPESTAKNISIYTNTTGIDCIQLVASSTPERSIADVPATTPSILPPTEIPNTEIPSTSQQHSKTQSVPPFDIPSPFKKALRWPLAQKRTKKCGNGKEKVTKEIFLFSICSEEGQTYHKKKDLEKKK